MNWYLEALKKYAIFSGRSRRMEYWFFVLFNLIVSFVIGFIEGLFGSPGIVGLMYAAAVFIPSIAVTVRRLHDTGRSGWYILLMAIPLAGIVLWFIWMVADSDSGPNQYGPNPKETAPLYT